jgi:thioredoxin reductase
MNLRLAPLAWGIASTVIALVLLAPRSSYQPGQLLAAHQQLTSNCSACHRQWRGPSNEGCVNCHGELGENNPHTGFDVSQEDIGLIPGHHLAVSPSHNLECLSCHTEHRGEAPNISAVSSFACTWCHKHPAIDTVAEHQTAVMQRQFFVRYLFKRSFNHYEHQLLIKSHYPPIPGGFTCTSCHEVPPVQPGGHEQMSFKWTGCAGVGCHTVPQDSFMQMPASVGLAPTTIPYSGVIPVRHIKAVFVHSKGHLQSTCEQCHFKVAESRDPVDRASLVILRCFNCHAHQPAPPERQAAKESDTTAQDVGEVRKRRFSVIPARGCRARNPDLLLLRHEESTLADHGTAKWGLPVSWDFKGLAFAAVPVASSGSDADRNGIVVGCNQCHLFHAYGVVPTLDFTSPAPKFPPNKPRYFELIVYVPHWIHQPGDLQLGPVALRPTIFSPWWMGLIAIGLVAYRFASFLNAFTQKDKSHEARPDVAPQRSKEVPALDDTYQTNVRHLYIVGEAAGTASINLAMRSGRQVIEAIANELRHSMQQVRPDLYDVAIVGCGPAGLGATATAKVMGLKYVTLEKLTPASTLRSYPRAKFVQATPIDIEEYGSFFLEGDNSREQLINEWEKIIAKLGLLINDREEVAGVVREQDYLVVKTARGNSYPSRTVVLAIGVRGNPRHLNLAGEVPDRVCYSLIEPNEYTGRKILVVGGGNAGAETAQALTDPRLRNTVSYSFRSPVLTNVTPENADALVALQKARVITIYPATALAEIRPHSAVLERVKSADRQSEAQPLSQTPIEIENDFIFAMIGAELPTAFLRAIGIKMVSKGRLYDTTVSSTR